MSNKAPKTRRRLTPEVRRQQIIQVARALFAEGRQSPITTADVAAAAGVTRALVHHYFHGIEELRDAVAMEIAQSTASLIQPDSAQSIEERVRANVRTFLDAVDANRDAWLATVGADEGASTPAGRALRQAILERILANNAEIIDDTPWSRLCLKGYIGFTDGVVREWVLEQGSREDTERAMTATLLHLLQTTIPDGQPSGRVSRTRKRSRSSVPK